MVSLDMSMELPEGIQGVDGQAETTLVAACDLTDAVAVAGWSRGAADDALEAIEVLAAALARVEGLDGPLAPVADAVVRARRHLDPDDELVPVIGAVSRARCRLGVDDEPELLSVPGPGCGAGVRPRRAGLGTGTGVTPARGFQGSPGSWPRFQGIRTER